MARQGDAVDGWPAGGTAETERAEGFWWRWSRSMAGAFPAGPRHWAVVGGEITAGLRVCLDRCVDWLAPCTMLGVLFLRGFLETRLSVGRAVDGRSAQASHPCQA